MRKKIVYCLTCRNSYVKVKFYYLENNKIIRKLNFPFQYLYYHSHYYLLHILLNLIVLKHKYYQKDLICIIHLRHYLFINIIYILSNLLLYKISYIKLFIIFITIIHSIFKFYIKPS
jgi:hypothetical protein